MSDFGEVFLALFTALFKIVFTFTAFSILIIFIAFGMISYFYSLTGSIILGMIIGLILFIILMIVIILVFFDNNEK